MSKVPPARVLLVEDDPIMRELLTDALSDAAFHVIVALDGLDALRSVSAARPDIVLLDLGLPALQGDDFVRRWRELDADAHRVPIIVVSGHDQAAARAEELGAAAFIAKPFATQDVVTSVRRATSRPLAPESTASREDVITIGEVKTSGPRAIRVSVAPAQDSPFSVEIVGTESTARVDLGPHELEVLLTLLDMAGRQRH